MGDPYVYTDLAKAPFLRPDSTEGVGIAREPISGLLMCGFDFDPSQAIGILHPNPVHAFDPRLLPNIEFGSIELDRDHSQLLVRWPDEARR